MKKLDYQFAYEVYDSIDELSEEDKWLLDEAREVTQQAYAPYSQFRVGAAARLSNGEFVKGTNQENAAYPVGMCAERVLLATVSSLYPNVPVDTMAISYFNQKGESDHPISPCGICRQYIHEYGERSRSPIRLILGGMTGKVYVIPDAGLLLPLSFGSGDLS